MDLSKMSRGDLGELQAKLRVIGIATDALAQGGLEPTICLTGDASVITVEPILSFGPVADVVLVEPMTDAPVPEPILSFVPVAEAVLVEPMSDSPVPEPVQEMAGELTESVSARLVQAVECAASSVSAEAQQEKKTVSELDLVSGPVTDAEKRQIEALHKQGMSNAEIALRLNRHGSIIGTCIYHLKRQAKVPAPALPEAKEPISEQAARQAVVTLAGQAADMPRAVSAVIQKLGGDQGGLQQLHPAENDPVQAGATPAAPAEAALVYTGEAKRVYQHVMSLGMPKGWDADLDLEMCEAFGQGTKSDQVALDLDVDSKQVRDRYADLTACIRNDRGHMMIEGQVILVRILRDRLKALRARAA